MTTPTNPQGKAPPDSQLGDVLDSGLGPLDADGTPLAMAEEPDGGSQTPPGYRSQKAGQAAPTGSGTWWARLLALLPDWLQTALFSKRAWEDWARSMASSFAMMVLMVVRQSASSLAPHC